MESHKRNRGRPRGTGINDLPLLEKIADAIAENPKQRPTTVMRRLYRSGEHRETEATLIRRLQVKWRAQKPELMQRARDRAIPRPARAPAAALGVVRAASVAEQMQCLLSPAAVSAAERIAAQIQGMMPQRSAMEQLAQQAQQWARMHERIFGPLKEFQRRQEEWKRTMACGPFSEYERQHQLLVKALRGW